jgi:hypothetical protein
MACISGGEGMTDKKQVKGLLDYISLKRGEEAELAPNSKDYVFGMGLGATEEATRWAYKAFLQENTERFESTNKKPNGRPKISFFKKKNNRRAFALWFLMKNRTQNKRAKITNRDLILLAQEVYNSNSTKDLFSERITATIEQSVSRGRTSLKIDENWNSEVCEKLYESLMQTTY